MDRSRRDLLAAAAALGTAGVAGCLDFAAGDGPQGPEGTPETLSCDDGTVDGSFVRLERPSGGTVATRSVETPGTSIELSPEGTSETYGNDLRLVLRNTGGEATTTLGRHAYSIQRETEAGWLDVRGSTTGGPATLPTAEESFAPSDGYTWDLTLDEAGLAAAVPDRDLAVCPPLGAGTHRFVYWGLPDSPAVGVEFELIG